MNRKYVLLLSFIIPLFLLNSCNYFNSEEAKAAINIITETLPEEVEVSPTFNVINKQNIEFEDLTDNYISQEYDGYTISVRYPSTSYIETNKLIEDLVYNNINNYISDEYRYTLNIDYEIIKHNDLFISFKFNTYNLTENTLIDIKTLVFNLDEYKNILIKDIFRPDTDYLQLLSKNTPIDILSDSTILNEQKFSNFVVNEENLIIYLSNNKSFEIPLKDINNGLLHPFDNQEILATENEKLIAITFDDGPNPYTTPMLLDGLAERNVKATFFMLGTCMEKNIDIVKRMYDEGHSIGNHSYNHKNMVKINNDNAKIQYNKPNEILNSIIATGSTVFRPPYGSYNKSIQNLSDVPMILWNIDPQDWKYKDENRIVNHMVEKAKDGDIILLHDIYPTSVTAALKAIDILQKQGFRFVTVDELIRRNGEEPNAGEIFGFKHKNK